MNLLQYLFVELIIQKVRKKVTMANSPEIIRGCLTEAAAQQLRKELADE